MAEIGVAFGTYSRQIVSLAAPARLHLIDLWRHQADAGYQTDLVNAGDAEQESRYRKVLADFAAEIAVGTVEVTRADSIGAAARFEQGSLDWVYVDARHDYPSVLADLRAYAPKIKANGFLLGHDFANHPQALKLGFGVIEAVRDFVAESGFSLLLLTNEAWPTYVLARMQDNDNARLLVAKILHSLPACVEITEPFSRYQQVARMIGDKPVVTPRF